MWPLFYPIPINMHEIKYFFTHNLLRLSLYTQKLEYYLSASDLNNLKLFLSNPPITINKIKYTVTAMGLKKYWI